MNEKQEKGETGRENRREAGIVMEAEKEKGRETERERDNELQCCGHVGLLSIHVVVSVTFERSSLPRQGMHL